MTPDTLPLIRFACLTTGLSKHRMQAYGGHHCSVLQTDINVLLWLQLLRSISEQWSGGNKRVVRRKKGASRERVQR